MIYLGRFTAGDTVFYGANFHSDQGELADPTTPTARYRDPAGTWDDLTTPAKQDTKTGFYGGTIDTTGFSAGQYIIRMAGTVATSKAVATVFCFEVGPVPTNQTGDAYARLGAPAGASVSADVAAVKSETASILADTAEIGTNGQGLTALASASNLATLTAYVDTEVAAIKASTDALTVKKNTALAGFTFPMYDDGDHVTPLTGLTITAERSIDGAAYGACANAVAEIGATGRYKIDLAAADLNGAVIALKFTATGADPVDYTIITQP